MAFTASKSVGAFGDNFYVLFLAQILAENLARQVLIVYQNGPNTHDFTVSLRGQR